MALSRPALTTAAQPSPGSGRHAWMPDPAPLPMTRQRLDAAPARQAPAGGKDQVSRLINTATVTVSALIALAVAALLARGIVNAPGAMAGALVALTGLSLFWLALAAATALIGLPSFRPAARAATVRPAGTTAVLMPVRNEPVETAAASLVAMAEGLVRQGAAARFSFFLLSDSDDPATIAAEQAAVAQLRARFIQTGPAVYYRRRRSGTGRKAGNIAHWVRGWGAAYPFMLVLDADSRMAASTMVALARRLAANPATGLIQTLPQLTGGASRFARLQEAASRLYGPVIARGLARRHGRSGNYWGHNAILRTRAFAACCALPRLKGRPPVGGEVLSHDFVEAALLRRAGWAVRLDADLGGSFEAPTPDLAAHAARDRRWCQGNCQHARFLGVRGLAWRSRGHFLAGIAQYALAPAWLAVVALAIMLAASPASFTAPALAAPLAAAVLLLLPRLAGAAAHWRQGRQPLLSTLRAVAAETLAGLAWAPPLLVLQARALGEVAIGRDAGWPAQPRRPGTAGWRDAVVAHGLACGLGSAGLGAGAVAAPALLPWLALPCSALALSPLTARWLARPISHTRPDPIGSSG